MKPLAGGLLLLSAFSLACKTEAPKPSPSPAQAGASVVSEEEKTAYAAGFMLGRNLAPLGLTAPEMESAKKGLSDAAAAKQPEFELQAYAPKIQSLMQARSAKKAEGEKSKAQAFLEGAAQEAGAEKTPSGLVYTTLAPGKGKSPKPTDVVKVHYRGTLVDGTEFDSSVKRGEPVEFALNQVIPCWTEGVQKMKIGEKAKLVCPSDIAYGDQGRPPTIPGGATLVFEVELLNVTPATQAAAPAKK